ncbi:hypothetical protein SBRCBS47491_001854 [Sporothrix bragantina]|uniref:Uncharacterized protein n=1 Tax=Sporothrix bragantina TaxID=671064 RepID=A0ABP0B246_9PEZI
MVRFWSTTSDAVYTSSFISTSFGRIVPLQWTPQLDKALHEIETRKECSTDEAFATQLCLNEATRLAVSEEPLVAPSLPTPRSPAGGVGSSSPAVFEHVACLWRSVHAAQAWLDAFCAVSPRAYVGPPFFAWLQLVRCIVVLKHLSTFADPAWDLAAVRGAVPLEPLLDRLAERTEQGASAMAAAVTVSRQVHELVGRPPDGQSGDSDGHGDGDGGLLRRVARMLRLSQRWMAAKQAQRTMEEACAAAQEAQAAQDAADAA